jgi:hypothetical protein
MFIFSGARFGCRAHAQGLDPSRTRRSTGRRSLLLGTPIIANQLVGLLVARRPVGQITRRVGFIVICARGSPAELGTPQFSLLRLFTQVSPVELGTRRCSVSSRKRRQLSWGLLWWSGVSSMCYQVGLILGSSSGDLISTLLLS